MTECKQCEKGAETFDAALEPLKHLMENGYHVHGSYGIYAVFPKDYDRWAKRFMEVAPGNEQPSKG